MLTKLDGKIVGGIALRSLVLAGIGALGYKLYKAAFPYDADGFDGAGYDCEGYNHHGFSTEGYNRNGYDYYGYDRTGFNSQGLNWGGYGRDGYNLNGFDIDGFNHEGRDKDGFDRRGYDLEGFHRNGYNLLGFNRDGFDWDGYSHDGYDASGEDRAGKNKQYYSGCLQKLYDAKEEAFKMMNVGEYGYALYNARVALEDALRLVIEHTLGPQEIGDGLLQKLKICEANSLLGVDADFLNRLHGVRKICNPGMHTLEGAENKTINQVYFAVAQVRDLIPVVRTVLAS